MPAEIVVIAGAARTPIGSLQGQFKSHSAPALGAIAIAAALERAGLDTEAPDEVFMGCVLPAGLGQAPARQASIAAGIPHRAGCTTVNKVCGSGMKAAMLGHDAILAGSAKVVVAGGMESMTNAPYLLKKARGGYRLGHDAVYDHMFLDGLEDAYERGTLMGKFAEDTAEKYQFTQGLQDEFAARIAGPRETCGGARDIRARDRCGARGRRGDRRRRASRPRGPGENPASETGVPRRRHGDRGQFQRHIGRRRGACSDDRGRGRAGAMCSRSRASWAMRAMRRRPLSSPPRPWVRFKNCAKRSAGIRTMSISTKSTRPLPW